MTRPHLVLGLAAAAIAFGSLHAQTPAPCDPVFHDKLVGAQNRSPSECEVQFDTRIREAEHRTFAGVVAALAEDHWSVKTETPLKPIMGIARNTEKELFRPGVTSGGGYDLTLALDPASAAAQAYLKRWNDLSDKLAQEISATGKFDGPAFVAFTKFNADGLGAINIQVSVSVNPISYEFVSFVAAHTVLQVAGATYAVAASQVQALSGGGPDAAASDVAFICLGKCGPATFEKLGDGGERGRIKRVVDPAAPRLSVQTVVIRIECNPALRDAVLKHMDLAALQSLLPR